MRLQLFEVLVAKSLFGFVFQKLIDQVNSLSFHEMRIFNVLFEDVLEDFIVAAAVERSHTHQQLIQNAAKRPQICESASLVKFQHLWGYVKQGADEGAFSTVLLK